MFFLIDYENVRNDGMAGVERLQEGDSVLIFYSKNAPNITLDRINEIIRAKCGFETYKLQNPGKNALDFYIATKTGQILGEQPDTTIAIVSGDKGFKYIADFWAANDPPRKVVFRPSIEQCIAYVERDTERGRQIAKRIEQNKDIDRQEQERREEQSRRDKERAERERQEKRRREEQARHEQEREEQAHVEAQLPEPEPTPAPAPAPEPVPDEQEAPAPKSRRRRSRSRHDRAKVESPEPEPTPTPEPEPAPEPEPEPQPEPVPQTPKNGRRRRGKALSATPAQPDDALTASMKEALGATYDQATRDQVRSVLKKCKSMQDAYLGMIKQFGQTRGREIYRAIKGVISL